MQADSALVAQLKELLTFVNSGGVGVILAWLIYRDLFVPRRNGKNGRAAGALNPKDFASERDLSNLGSSFRDFRKSVSDDVSDARDRVSRLEGRVDEALAHLRKL